VLNVKRLGIQKGTPVSKHVSDVLAEPLQEKLTKCPGNMYMKEFLTGGERGEEKAVFLREAPSS